MTDRSLTARCAAPRHRSGRTQRDRPTGTLPQTRDLQIHRLADRPCPQWGVGRGEHGHDLPVGRMVRQLRGRRRRRGRIRQRQQSLAGDADLLGNPVELLQLRGEFSDASPRGPGLRGDLALLLLQTRQHRSQGQLAAAHAPRQVGVEVEVSIRAIRSLMAQYTLDSAEAGRCS